jgi:CRISPR-associated protein Cmr3
MTTVIFLRAFDVLLFRGNKLFGDPGSYGETMSLPWPSVAAGAIRSALLARKSLPLVHRGGWEGEDPELGTPVKPGSFTVTAWQPARRYADGRFERIYPLPADLVVAREDTRLLVHALHPAKLAEGLRTSYSLPQHPVLAERERSKPESGLWLLEEGWKAYLDGQVPAAEQLVPGSELWATDTRVGVGLDRDKRAAAEGRLFTVQALAPRMPWTGDKVSARYEVGYFAEIAGAELPDELTLRLGGDGRAAVASQPKTPAPQPDYAAGAKTHRCRLVLTTPGLFDAGWLPTGSIQDQRREDGAVRFELLGVAGWIVAAAVPRFEVVSGWDLAQWEPKPALRAVPTGSVYWLDLDENVTEAALCKLAEQGLWTDGEYASNMRRAEGFNRLTFALWK